jgi:hypothetical protein
MATTVLESCIRNVRYMFPKDCDRIAELAAYVGTCGDYTLIQQELQLVAIKRNTHKLQAILSKLENLLMKKGGFNLVVHNIPIVATELETNKVINTNYGKNLDSIRLVAIIILILWLRQSNTNMIILNLVKKK